MKLNCLCFMELSTESVTPNFVITNECDYFQVGIFFWPVLQTINFAFVPEKNRVPYVSACSLVWCCFLSYMHQLQLKKQEKQNVEMNRQTISN